MSRMKNNGNQLHGGNVGRIDEMYQSLSGPERDLLVEFSDQKLISLVAGSARLAEIVGMPNGKSVTRAMAKFRRLGVLTVDDYERTLYWPQHHRATALSGCLTRLHLELKEGIS